MKDMRRFSAAVLAVLLTAHFFTSCSKEDAEEPYQPEETATEIAAESSEDPKSVGTAKSVRLNELDRSKIRISPYTDLGMSSLSDIGSPVTNSEERNINSAGMRDRSYIIFPYMSSFAHVNSYVPDSDTSFSYPEDRYSFVNGNGEDICDEQYLFYKDTPFDNIYIVESPSNKEGLITDEPDKKTAVLYDNVEYPDEQWVSNSNYEHKDCFICSTFKEDGEVNIDIVNRDMETIDKLSFKAQDYMPRAVSAILKGNRPIIFDEYGYKLIDGNSGELVFADGLLLDKILSDDVVVLVDYDLKYYLAGTDGRIISGPYDNTIYYCFSDMAIFSNDDSPYLFHIFGPEGEEVFRIEDIISADVYNDVILFGLDGSRYMVYDKEFNKLSDKPVNGEVVHMESGPNSESKCYMNINDEIIDIATGEVLLKGVSSDFIALDAGILCYFEGNGKVIYYDMATSTKFCTDHDIYGSILLVDPVTNKRYIQFDSGNDDHERLLRNLDSIYCIDTGTLVNIDTTECNAEIKDDLLYLSSYGYVPDRTFVSLYDISDPSDPKFIFEHFASLTDYSDQE